MTRLIGWLLGVGNMAAIDQIDVVLAAPWAQRNFFWLLFGLSGCGTLSVLFYRRWQHRGSPSARTVLAVCRGLLLGLLLLTLAAPVLHLTIASVQPPTLMLVFDGTDSMSIEDDWLDEQRTALDRSVGWDAAAGSRGPGAPRSRRDYLQALLRRDQENVIDELQHRTGARVEAFLFDGHTTSQLRRLEGDVSDRERSRRRWAEQLTTRGQVSALGAVLEEIRRQSPTHHLAGVILFSDFAHNSGPPPTGEGPRSVATVVGVPIHTVGLGAVETRDLAVDLQVEPRLKKAERTTLIAQLRQSGLTGSTAQLRWTARRLRGDSSGERQAEIGPEIGPEIGQTQLRLSAAVESAELAFTPQDSGPFEFVVTIEPLEGESVHENNRASRQVTVIDDYLRLLYVAYEPEWEWRFVKEVFHRDKLVGLDGFRTYLGSSDPRVREVNSLFVPTLTPKRAEFFSHDVLFLGDMPASALSARFCEMVREYVGNLGGGLVVLSGPRFGPRELLGTPLAEMLPVVIDANSQLRDQQPFRLQRTAQAALYPFMRLGDSAAENEKAWSNLEEQPWYQPVAALHEQAVVLAEHPSDMCHDGTTPQPLIAIRQFGRGEVVYLGFNEIWRLRRKYGERYYRQFWSQLIYRLGMSHALGATKRFVVRLDRAEYRVEDQVTLTVEAYDADYEPLATGTLAGGGLSAELRMPARDGAASSTAAVTVPELRRGLFETRFPVYAAGEYSIRVHDPVTGQVEERQFKVLNSSVERRRVVRDLQLQEALALQTGGRSYDLTNVDRLPRELRVEPFVEKQTRNQPLWNTPLWFILVIGLMLGEWLQRKRIQLP